MTAISLMFLLSLSYFSFVYLDSVEIQTIPSNTGMYTKKLGHLNVIEQYYTLIIIKDIKPLYNNVNRIQNLLKKFELIESKLQGTHHTSIHSLTLKKNIKRTRIDPFFNERCVSIS